MVGKHYLLNLYGCSFDSLNNTDYLIQLIESAAIQSRATILKTVFEKFEPQGFTGICLLAESHISIHTYPELGNCYVDIFTCGESDPKIGCDYIIQELNPNDYVLEFHQR